MFIDLTLFLQAAAREAQSSSTSQEAPVRLVDGSGAPSNAGLLQVRVGDGSFGTVCGMTLAAVDVVCRQLGNSYSSLYMASLAASMALTGYDYGSLASSPCGSYGGRNICGATGSPVSMQGLTCKGDELSVGECSWSTPDADCSRHALDSVVFCGENGRPAVPEGAARLLSSDGTPSLSGSGLLEMRVGDAWSPICGVSPGAATVACKLMGFTAASADVSLASGTTKEPRVGDLDCGGSEASLLDCSFREGEDVFCAPEEAALIHCAGEGDPTGRMGKEAAHGQ